MNPFYSIAERENIEPEHPYQLSNMGSQTPFATLGKKSHDGWGRRSYESRTFYRTTTTEDYDGQFTNKLLTIKPPYEIDKVLDYHLEYYLKNNKGSKDKFIKHIKYVIIPLLQKWKSSNVYEQLVNEWIIMKNEDFSKKKNRDNVNVNVSGGIHAPTQVQIYTENSNQSQTITYSNDNILELFELIKKDIKQLNSEFTDDLTIEVDNALKQLNKGKDITGRLLTIGGLIKDIGIGVFTNLLASPIYEAMKPSLGL